MTKSIKKIISGGLNKLFPNRNINPEMPEIVFESKEEFDRIKSENNATNNSFWEEKKLFWGREDYSAFTISKELYTNRLLFIYDNLMSKLTEREVIADVGCGAGEWTFLIAERARLVDGYDLSQSQIDYAVARANTENISNANFVCGDICEIELDKQYDYIVCLGMMIYIEDDDVVLNIIKNMYNALKPGGQLLYNNTINIQDKDVLYIFNKTTKYQATYRCKEVEHNFFEKCGFKLIKETTLDITDDGFSRIGLVWEK